jgi:hypothetical protein
MKPTMRRGRPHSPSSLPPITRSGGVAPELLKPSAREILPRTQDRPGPAPTRSYQPPVTFPR